MNKNLTELLESIKGVPDFYGVEFNSINDTNALGDNTLHCVCVWGDITAAKLLMKMGSRLISVVKVIAHRLILHSISNVKGVVVIFS